MAERALPVGAFGVPRRRESSRADRVGFALLVLYLAVEYGRPQDLLPGLSGAPVGLATAVPLAAAVVAFRARFDPLERILLPWLLLLTMMTAWVPLAHNNFWAFQVWKLLVLYTVVLLAFVTFVTTEERLRILLRAWLGVLVVQALHGLASAGRGTGAFFGDENDYAMAMNLGLALAVFTFRAEPSRMMRLLLAGAGLLFLLGVVASRSRGGFVGLAVVGLAVVVVSRHRLRLALVAGTAGVFLLAAAPHAYWSEMSTILDPNASTRVERFRHWEIATDMFVDNPVVGVGQGNLPWRAGDYEVYDTTVERSLEGRVAHSAWFTLVAELGLVGTLLYLWIGLEVLRAGLRVRRARSPALLEYGSGLLAASVAWGACSAFLSTLYYPHPYFLAGGLVAAARIADREGSPEAER